MAKLIAAHTNLDQQYPGYINFSREDDGTVSVHFRGDPSEHNGRFICGHSADKGKPGRCTPGDENCNNYCNMAPAKGPMADAPKDCVQVIEGACTSLKLSAADFDALLYSATQVAEAAVVVEHKDGTVSLLADVDMIDGTVRGMRQNDIMRAA